MPGWLNEIGGCTGRHEIPEILLKVTLNTKNQNVSGITFIRYAQKRQIGQIILKCLGAMKLKGLTG